MLYSKNGSIPKPQTDGTEGWVEVEDMPIAPEGKEVVWWCPPGWVVRDPQPGPNYSWSQSQEEWVEYTPVVITEEEVTIIGGASADVSIGSAMASAGSV